MRAERLGEGAAILRDFDADPAALAEAIEAAGFPGLVEAAACYATVGVYFEPGFDLGLLDREWTVAPPTPRRLTIPVCYEVGPDLAEVSERLGIGADEIAFLHASVEYRCSAVGFCPGFAYLGDLPAALQGIPRRSVPRTAIEPGMVGITGSQTGAYPMRRPGGWALIGRTPLVLVDVDSGYFPIRAGDLVRFRSIDPTEFARLEGERL